MPDIPPDRLHHAPDRVHVQGIEFHGFHGVTEAERELGHRFTADVMLELNLGDAGSSDDLGRSVDYAAVAQAVLDVGQGPSVRLVETLAEEMAAQLLRRFERAQAVTVRLLKLYPPAPLPFRAAGVEIRRYR